MKIPIQNYQNNQCCILDLQESTSMLTLFDRIRDAFQFNLSVVLMINDLYIYKTYENEIISSNFLPIRTVSDLGEIQLIQAFETPISELLPEQSSDESNEDESMFDDEYYDQDEYDDDDDINKSSYMY
ncbi:Hypothetical_protein [Hexamita inflata]|uniref:Hypothetical_protein n=1 Tax=Hexamita inflata TaxID=28002 RepID=A0AA86PHW8_9EUKA|nr:Hypothetical protein HINF_LOCUS26217 [Hexamita inflata]